MKGRPDTVDTVCEDTRSEETMNRDVDGVVSRREVEGREETVYTDEVGKRLGPEENRD